MDFKLNEIVFSHNKTCLNYFFLIPKKIIQTNSSSVLELNCDFNSVTTIELKKNKLEKNTQS